MTGVNAVAKAEDGGPLASATASLIGWLRGVTGGDVRLGPPGPAADGPRIDVWPLELRADPEMRTHQRREPLRLRVRHLVTGDAVPLGQVLAAATAAGEPAVDLTPLPAQAWLALGGQPRPALLVDMPAVIERPQPQGPFVTEKLRLTMTPR